MIESRNPPVAATGRWWMQCTVHLQVLVALAFLFGGGGSAYGLANMVVQLAALACMALHKDRVFAFFHKAPRSLLILLGLTFALPVLQLIPLPPALWQQLPGRNLVLDAYAAAGISTASWVPLTANAGRTLIAICAMLPPFAILALATTLDRRDLERVASAFVAMALISVLFGTIQVSTANTVGILYQEKITPSVLYAFMANRNSTGIMLVCAITVLAWLPLHRKKDMELLIKAVIGGILSIGVVITQSRASIAILALILLAAGCRWAWIAGVRRQGDRRAMLIGGLIAVVLGGAVAVSTLQGGRADIAASRFSRSVVDDDRMKFWEDALYTTRHYWPVGVGMGSFSDVFQIDESLENLTPRRAGRAHNDYLEVAVEAGLTGLAMIAAWIAWVAAMAVRQERRGGDWRGIWPGLTLACLMLQSFVDYPLRNQTVLCIAGFAVALLIYRQRGAAQ